MVNEVERRRWNDELMVARWPKRERFTDQVVPHVVNALQPAAGEKVLDIGAGGGKLSLAIAEKVRPGGKVLGADISDGMVNLATGRAGEAKAKGVSFMAADVQVDKVPGGPFDAAVSQFGVMFFDEPVTAFTNIRKHLKKGGRIAFACWQGPRRTSGSRARQSVLSRPLPRRPLPGSGRPDRSRWATRSERAASCRRQASPTLAGRRNASPSGLRRTRWPTKRCSC